MLIPAVRRTAGQRHEPARVWGSSMFRDSPVWVCLIGLAAVPAARGEERRSVDFARDVRPILANRCFRCHGPKKQEGGLRLDSRRRAMQGGDTGLAIRPGKVAGELLRRITATGE